MTVLATTVANDHVVLVAAPVDSTTGDPTLSLLLFQGDELGGTARLLECRLPADQRLTCGAAFAFFLAQADLQPEEVGPLTDQLLEAVG